MEIDSLTIGEAKKLALLFQSGAPALSAAPWNIGANYFIRTVTHHLTGKLVEVYPTEIVLMDAAWIADDGRFSEAIEKETFSEVEPFPAGRRLIVGRSSLIDAIEIKKLPRSQK